jgi:hypothetical protein
MSFFVSMPKDFAWTQKTGGLYATLTSQVVVYAPAERADHRDRYYRVTGDREN